MKKTALTALAIVAALGVCAPVTALAAKKEKQAATAADAAGKPIPYHGKVASVDASAKTFTIKGKEKDRVFSVTDKTTIMKDGAAADLSAITQGEEVHGSATKSGDSWEAIKVIVGAKEKKTAKKDEAKPSDASATEASKPADASADKAAADTAAPASDSAAPAGNEAK